MLDPYGPVEVENARERYRELVEEIERVHMFDDPEARGAHVHKRVLFGAGNLFVALGKRLQSLSSLEASATPALRRG
jgi:hypothetical protein